MSEEARRRAVALGGDGGRHASRVLAKGYGDIAIQVIEAARSHDIYVHESPELVALLMRLDLDERVPPRLYEVVAELLAWLAELDGSPSVPASVAIGAAGKSQASKEAPSRQGNPQLHR